MIGLLPDGHGHGERDDSQCCGGRSQEERNKSHPQDASGVSREADIAGLIKTAGTLASLEGVDSAATN